MKIAKGMTLSQKNLIPRLITNRASLQLSGKTKMEEAQALKVGNDQAETVPNCQDLSQLTVPAEVSWDRYRKAVMMKGTLSRSRGR